MTGSADAEAQARFPFPVVRQVETGRPPADVCRQLGVSEATLYIWKRDAPTGRRGAAAAAVA
jgi:transposase-like protein